MNEVITCIMERRSVRSFQDRAIDRKDLEQILYAGIHAPNGQNRQTWRFTVLSTKRRIDYYRGKVEKILSQTQLDSLHGFENPAAIIIVSDRRSNYNAMVNGACALENMMLAAYSIGIGSCWNNALRTIQDEEEIRNGLFAELGIPDTHRIAGSLLLGYIKEDDLAKKPRRRTDVIQFIE